jgi:hypothetical protein
MTSLAHAVDGGLPPATDAAPSGSLWRRFMQRFAGGEPPDEPVPPSRGHRLPVFRITRVWADRWLVQRPGSPMEHAFDGPAGAEAFVRHECGDRPVMVELRIGELYVAARLDPDRPSLFGGAD